MPGYTFDAFKLGLDYNNSILFLDRRDMFIHEGFGNSQYFKFLLLDRNRKEKISINLSGKDKANDKKYDKLDNFNFEIGDYVVIYHAEPSRLNFSNITGEDQGNKNEQIYKITTTGLESLSLFDKPTGPEVLPLLPPDYGPNSDLIKEDSSVIGGNDNEKINRL